MIVDFERGIVIKEVKCTNTDVQLDNRKYLYESGKIK